MRLKLTLAYDGTAYLGWQKTAEGPSIEAALERALTTLLSIPVALHVASRTDRGVHAQEQVVHFDLEKLPYDLRRLQLAINGLLPRDITLISIEEVSIHFHATLSVHSKTYLYTLCYHPIQLPHQRYYTWHFPYPLDLQRMREGAALFLGTHNFQSFCNQKKNEPYRDHVRHIDHIRFDELENKRVAIRICGKNFLYKMVRNIVGTIAYIGCGKISLEELPAILAAKDRTLAGVTAPAHGLILERLEYLKDTGKVPGNQE